MEFSQDDLIYVWEHDSVYVDSKPFRLELYYQGIEPYYGKTRLGYKFYDDGVLIFSGNDFCVPASRYHVLESLNTVESLLGFLSLSEYDTDSEYFDNYTQDQLNWRDSSRREELSYICYDLYEQLYEKG